MPRYDYRCSECLHIFEIRCSINAPQTPEVCPRCNCSLTSRIYSIPNVIGTNQKQSSGCGSCASGSCTTCGHAH